MSQPYGNPPGPGNPGPPPGPPPPGWGPPGPPTGPPPPGWGPPGAPPGPPPPRRRTGLIVVVVIACLVLLGGGVTAGVVLTGGDDDAASASDESPSESPTAEDESSEEPSGETESDDFSEELAAFESKLEGYGFSCYQSFTKPYDLRSCYMDPAPSQYDYGEVQTVRDSSGQVRYIHASAFSVASKPTKKIPNATFKALKGTLLKAPDIATLRKNPHGRELRLSWGIGSWKPGTLVETTSLTIRKPGFDFGHRGARYPRVPDREVARYLEKRGFECIRRNTECGKDFGGRFTYVYRLGYARDQAGRRTLARVEAMLGIDGTAGALRVANRAVHELFVPIGDFALGGNPDSRAELREWLMGNVDVETHEADIGGLHIRFGGQSGGGVTGREVAIVMEIESITEPLLVLR